CRSGSLPDRAAVPSRRSTATPVDHGGVIPTYGAKKQIDPAEAERLWPPRTMGTTPPRRGRELDRQRLRKLTAEAARAELELRVRRGELLDRQKGLDTVFRFGAHAAGPLAGVAGEGGPAPGGAVRARSWCGDRRARGPGARSSRRALQRALRVLGPPALG